jgi:hypothetical protein
MNTITNQICINKDSFEIAFYGSIFKENNRMLVFMYNEINEVNFIYPKWRKYSAFRSIGLFLFNFFLNTSEFNDSVKVNLEIKNKNMKSENYELLFHTIKDAEETEKKIKTQLYSANSEKQLK